MNTKRCLVCILSIFLTLAIALSIFIPSQVARADENIITVTTTIDEINFPDYCTLRDAITAADNDSDTGGCPAGSGADTIVLASDTTYILNTRELSIHSQITVEGNGSTITRSSADGTPVFRIFYVAEAGDLTLNELTVSNGTNVYEGGGIKNYMGTLTINHSTITGNRNGSIINLYGASLNINNSTISDNLGCGIINLQGSVVIDQSTISGNFESRNGGGIHNSDGIVDIYNSTISDNIGAGIVNLYGSVIINSTTVSGNHENTNGGGIHNYFGSAEIANSAFSGNSADSNGGGIYNRGGVLNLTSSTISNNTSEENGGGMYNLDSNPKLVDVTFTGNLAHYEGGGLANTNSDPTLTNVIFTNNKSYDGGGIFNSNGNPTLTNVIFSENAATWGGGMYNKGGSPTLSNVTFSSNLGGDVGGGMYTWGGSPSMFNTILWNNTAYYAGDQILNYESALAISHTLIQNSGGSGAGWDASLGTDGGGNIDADPLFVDTINGDLHLNAGSPAIDSGDDNECPPTDLDGVDRPQGVACDMGAFELEQTEVDIEIKPGSDAKCINDDGNGVLPVAIFGNADLFAHLIDPKSVELEGLTVASMGNSNKLLAAYEDVNEDGYMDLVVKFEKVEGSFFPGSSIAVLTGTLRDGTLIFGVDDICLVP